MRAGEMTEQTAEVQEVSSRPANVQATKRAESLSEAQRVVPGMVHVLTIVDGRGGWMRFEVGAGQAFWLAAGLRRLLGGQMAGEGCVLKVQSGDHVYLLSRRTAWGEQLIHISELFDPSATVVLNETTSEMLAALMESASSAHAASVTDSPAGEAAGH